MVSCAVAFDVVELNAFRLFAIFGWYLASLPAVDIACDAAACALLSAALAFASTALERAGAGAAGRGVAVGALGAVDDVAVFPGVAGGGIDTAFFGGGVLAFGGALGGGTVTTFLAGNAPRTSSPSEYVFAPG